MWSGLDEAGKHFGFCPIMSTAADVPEECAGKGDAVVVGVEVDVAADGGNAVEKGEDGVVHCLVDWLFSRLVD